ncbi:hypothetical protein Tmari_1295 [Thermotoga maritima MSB8]|jgi:hypothetical protein|nr:hypothetical protein Tmari_1295 [Thermotoga maritima MSB8]
MLEILSGVISEDLTTIPVPSFIDFSDFEYITHHNLKEPVFPSKNVYANFPSVNHVTHNMWYHVFKTYNKWR